MSSLVLITVQSSLVISEAKLKQEKTEFDYKNWLAVRSCSKKEKLYRCIVSYDHPERVDFMFNKKIKLFMHNQIRGAYLITEDGETHFWSNIKRRKFCWSLAKYTEDTCVHPEDYCIKYYSHELDFSNTRIIKAAICANTLLILTDDGEMYYYVHYNKETLKIRKINVKEKITFFACGHNFFMLFTDNGKIYLYNDLNRIYNTELDIKYHGYHANSSPLSNNTIVKIINGYYHTFILTDEGKVYICIENCDGHTGHKIVSLVMMEIPNVMKVSDIVAMKYLNIFKSSEDGLVYTCGLDIKSEQVLKCVCEYTNIFDISNMQNGYSPASTERVITNEESVLLNDIKDAFNDRSTSDLTIKVEEQSIYVHKFILMIRSVHFKQMFHSNWIENSQSIIKHQQYSYFVYRAFLKYLYTGTIDLSSLDDELELLKLANEYCQDNLEYDCIQIIKKKVDKFNAFSIYDIAIKLNIKILEEYCFKFIIKNMTYISETEGLIIQADNETKKNFINKAVEFLNLSMRRGS